MWPEVSFTKTSVQLCGHGGHFLQGSASVVYRQRWPHPEQGRTLLHIISTAEYK